jgi:hypothetical protein
MADRSVRDGRSSVGRRAMRRHSAMLRADATGIGSVSTVLMVVMVVAMMSIVGAYAMGLFKPEAPAPTLEVMSSVMTDSNYAHIRYASELRPLHEFRVMARLPDGTMVRYDSDGDAVADATMNAYLDNITVGSATDERLTPVVYVDMDGDGRVGPGDYFTFRDRFYPVLSPFIDMTRGYKMVGMAPSGVHRDSDMMVYASPSTLPGSDIEPGDTVRVTIGKGATVYYTAEGVASGNGVWTSTVHIPIDWVPATYGATSFTVRPGEVDEWSTEYPIKVMPENPVSKADRAYWEYLNSPIVDGTTIVLVHRPSNEMVMELVV